MTAAARWEDVFAARRGTLPGAGPAAAVRDEAMAAFQRRGLPTGKDEGWRYTALGTLATAALPASAEAAPGDGLSLPGAYVVDVRGDRVALPGAAPPRGVTVLRLADLLASDPESGARALGSGVDPGAFQLLNAALAPDGVVIRIEAGTAVEVPIHLRCVAAAAGQASFPRILVEVGEDAVATLLESHAGGGEALTDAVMEIDLASRASLTHVKLQAVSEEAHHLQTTRVRQGPRSTFRSRTFALGGKLGRSELTTVLGEGAEVELQALSLGHGRQVLGTHTLIDHASPGAKSQQLAKAIVEDRARAVFDGRIVVRPGAQQTDARQASKNLLLSPEAEVDTKPQLEIYADDVKCAHGATSGYLDEDALFYLRSRGIGEAEARRLLILAFASDLVAAVPSAPIRRLVLSVLAERLPEVAAYGEEVA